MAEFGLDYVSGPPIADMQKANVAFVCRYLSEQSTSFGPFMRKFILFLAITRHASNYQITDIVSGNAGTRNTAQRKGVVNGLFAPFYMFSTVVAFPFLSIILCPNISQRVLARDSFFQCTPVVFSDAKGRLVSHVIVAASYLHLPCILCVPPTMPFKPFLAFDRPIRTPSGIYGFFVTSPICSNLGADNFPMNSIMSMLTFQATWLTAWLQSKLGMFMEIVKRGREYLLTLRASFIALFHWFHYRTPALFLALLTSTAQSIQSTVSRIEVLRGSGEPFETGTALLARGIVRGYSVHAVRTHLLIVTPGECSTAKLHSSGKQSLPLHYSITPLYKQLHTIRREAFYCLF